MNALDNLAQELERHENEVHVDPALIERAMVPLNRMLAFARNNKSAVKGNA